MSEIELCGDLQNISEHQIQFILSVLKERGYENAKVTVEPVGKAGDNYSSNIKRIVADKNGEQFKMIAKIAHHMTQLRETVNVNEIFCNENALYVEILPQFTEIEKQAGIPDPERLKYATCYGTMLESPNEVILLEDLQVSGYVILDRFKSLTDHDIKLVLKDFAKLHSLSYALKNQKPEIYSSYKEKLMILGEMLKKKEMLMFFNQVQQSVIDLIDKEEHKKAMDGIISGVADIMNNLLKIDFDSRFSVIQQGDSWTNNIMFKVQDGKSIECCMIDYQQARINSPVADLMYMIFNCTDYDTRKQHFHQWKDFYHSQLEKCLSVHGLKIGLVYPRDQLDADLKRHGKLSLSQSALLAAILIRQSGDVEKMKALMEQNASIDEMLEAMGPESMDLASVMRYKARLEGLIDSHLELGFI